jgi:hypothetical protein
MKKLRLVPVEDQGQKGPQRGQDVYVAIDLSRRKWVYGLRWGGEFRRRWSSPAGLEHVQAVVTSNPRHVKPAVQLCIDVCTDCERACRKHEAHHAVCKACADACAATVKAARVFLA